MQLWPFTWLNSLLFSARETARVSVAGSQQCAYKHISPGLREQLCSFCSCVPGAHGEPHAVVPGLGSTWVPPGQRRRGRSLQLLWASLCCPYVSLLLEELFLSWGWCPCPYSSNLRAVWYNEVWLLVWFGFYLLRTVPFLPNKR